MSLPIEPDYILLQVKVGTTYTTLCGIETAGVNQTANTTDRFRRDCAKPADIPSRTVRVASRQWDLTGNGVLNMDQFDLYTNVLGAHSDFRLLYGRYDAALDEGERTGTTYGYRDGKGVMTAANESLGGDDATADVTIAGEGTLTWTEGAPA
jgi:hypothetical protein